MARRSFVLLLTTFLAWSCGEAFDETSSAETPDSVSAHNVQEKNAPGHSCAWGCVWSGWAVALGAQAATNTCGGQPCACVAVGNIYHECSASSGQPDLANSSADWFGEEDESNDSPWSPDNMTVLAGSSCGSGCVWSSFAVQLGAQSGEADCGAGQCACVQNGNVWLSCDDSSEPQNQPQSSPQAQPRPQAQPSSPPLSTGPYGGHYDSAMGNQLADIAYGIATRRNTVGDCYNAAADAIESVVPRFLYGMSAYMAADQLAAHPRFTEISTGNLRGLPAGAVVVWGKGSSDHGHISIALGDGREASDHVTAQMTYHYGGAPARVFLPR